MLLRSVLNETFPLEPNNEIDFDFIFRITKANSVTNTVFYAVEQLENQPHNRKIFSLTFWGHLITDDMPIIFQFTAKFYYMRRGIIRINISTFLTFPTIINFIHTIKTIFYISPFYPKTTLSIKCK